MPKYLALLALLFATPAVASDWQQVATGAGRIYYIDASSITPITAGVAKAWIKTDLSRVKTEVANYSVARWEFVCSLHQMKITSVTTYRVNGTVIASQSNPYGNYDDIVPDSTGQAVEAVVCAASH